MWTNGLGMTDIVANSKYGIYLGTVNGWIVDTVCGCKAQPCITLLNNITNVRCVESLCRQEVKIIIDR